MESRKKWRIWSGHRTANGSTIGGNLNVADAVKMKGTLEGEGRGRKRRVRPVKQIRTYPRIRSGNRETESSH